VSRGVAACAALALAALGCASLGPLLHPPKRLGDCPAPIVATEDLPGGPVRLREQVRYAGRGVDAAFDLVVEKQPERLVLVGLNALGTRLFSVVQTGGAVDARSLLGRALAVPPANVLRDLHATHFADADAPVRSEIARPACGYVATFVTVERRALP